MVSSPAGPESSSPGPRDAADEDLPSPGPQAFYIGDGDNDAASRQCDEDSLANETLTDYVDRALELAGGSGRFQWRYTWLLTIPWVFCGLQTMAHVFTTMPVRRRRVCHQHADVCDLAPLLDEDCSVMRGDYEFTAPKHSVVSDFDLICDAAFYVPLLGTIFFLGFLLGVTLLGAHADSRGRRKAYLLSLVLFQGGALMAVLAQSYGQYALARFVTGFGNGGLGLCVYVWNAEVLGPKSRSILVVVSNTGFALGAMLLSPLSYWVRPWRWLSGVLFALGLPLFGIYGLLESPKWLAANGKADAVEAVLSRVAEVNGRPRPPPPPKQQEDSQAQQRAKAKAGPAETIRQLTLDPRLSRRFHVMCFNWFAASLGYYGISMNVSHLGGSIYLASALSALVELPAYVVATYTVETSLVGRRGSVACSLLMGGLACVLCVTAVGLPGEEPGGALLAMVFTGKFSVALAFAVLYLYAAELFPTDMRSQAIGLQSLAARLGGMLAPIVADLGRTSQALPLLIFGAPCIAAGLLLSGLPETRGMPMANSARDLEPPGSWPCTSLCSRRYRELQEDAQRTPGQPPPMQIGNAM